MNSRLHVVRTSVWLLVALAISLPAQSVRGEITADGGIDNGVSVELQDVRFGAVNRVSVGATGDFSFDSVRPGDYRLRVTDRYGSVLREEFVQVTEGGNWVNVHLRERRAARPPSGTVSVQQLAHKVPKKAQKEFEKALKAADQGDSGRAIEHLNAALEIDPAFLEAYNNLGARYMHLKQYERAADEFRKALRLDPNCSKTSSNLALALLSLERLSEAEENARTAVRSDPTSEFAKYVLGVTLAIQNREPEEALGYLAAASERIPRARLAAAQVLAGRGAQKEAAAELKQYLASGDPESRERVKAWLAELER